jgi:membrane-associated phospholipid phosphatase
VFRDLTVLGSYTVIIASGLLVAWFLAIMRNWISLMVVMTSVLGGALINSILKRVFERPRPDVVPHLVEVQTASLPSGHAMLSAVAYLTFAALLAESRMPWRLIALLIGSSRAYLGVHLANRRARRLEHRRCLGDAVLAHRNPNQNALDVRRRSDIPLDLCFRPSESADAH